MPQSGCYPIFTVFMFYLIKEDVRQLRKIRRWCTKPPTTRVMTFFFMNRYEKQLNVIAYAKER